MLLDRRTFILTAGSFAVAYSSFGLPLAPATPLNIVTGGPLAKEVRFRIDGWNLDVDSSVDEYVIRFNQNWRCAWR